MLQQISHGPVKRNISVRVLFRIRSVFQRFHIFVRIGYFKALGASIGKHVKLGAVSMQVPEQVAIGDGCDIEDQVRLRVGGPWKEASITVGRNTFIGYGTQVNIRGHFKIGKECLIAPMCLFSDAHHRFDDINIPIKQQPTTFSPIEVMDNVWLGSGVTVLGGVTINTGAVIAAGAVVTTSVPAYEVWGGVPAKKIKTRIP